MKSLQWHHNERDGVSNHRHLDGLLNRLSRRRSKTVSKLRVTSFARGIHQWPVNSPYKGPVTRKIFPFDDIIMMLIDIQAFSLKMFENVVYEMLSISYRPQCVIGYLLSYPLVSSEHITSLSAGSKQVWANFAKANMISASRNHRKRNTSFLCSNGSAY